MTEKEEIDLNPYGVSETKRLTIPSAENVLYKPFQCLDHGFVRLVDYMGGDESIVQAARVSYGRGTKKVSEDKGLIRYLMRHIHTTPFEMVETKFHAKLPIFVARQWVRHRTASINEYSARYSILDNEFYVPSPEDLGIQAKSNRQGRDEPVGPEQAQKILELLKDSASRAYEGYENLLNDDGKGNPKNPEDPMLARELARMNLSLNFYTQWYWKTNLHNLFHFLGLRKDAHAQKEIRVYADHMGEMARAIAPNAYEAFEDYNLNGMLLSSLDIKGLSKIMKGEDKNKVAEEIFVNKRERIEFLGKLERI
ncbi:FAD-dependent thymidylate synthase [Candidatus Pacearchaeota archaeon]|nr:FAD-dependent thymidylate synthase [Candidatus Pacearchaeota archaeon]